MVLSFSVPDFLKQCADPDSPLFFTGVEIPKFVDKTTPEYKPKFDALVRNHI